MRGWAALMRALGMSLRSAADLLVFNNDTQEALESEVKSRFAQIVHLWRKGELEPTRYLEWRRAREGGG